MPRRVVVICIVIAFHCICFVSISARTRHTDPIWLGLDSALLPVRWSPGPVCFGSVGDQYNVHATTYSGKKEYNRIVIFCGVECVEFSYS